MEKFKQIKDRLLENFKKNKVLLIVFAIVWATLIVFTLNNYNNTLGRKSSGNESYDRSVIEVNKNTSIEAVVPVENNADSVAIMYATYARSTNKGEVNVQITGEQTLKEYANETISVNSIEDNAYHTYSLNEPLKINEEKKIKIKITSNSEENQAIGIYYSNVKWFELDSSFSINGEKIENTDLMTRFTMYDESYSKFSNAVITWSIIGLSLLVLILLLINPKPEVMFATMIIIMGLIFMIIIVPMSPPDEQTHYEISLKLSNMMMGQDPRYIDSSYLKYGSMYGHYNISAGYNRFMEQFGQSHTFTDTLQEFNHTGDVPYYVDYLPQAIGVTIARLLDFNMITLFYCGRLFNLIFYTICVYFAIKKAASFKFLIGMLATMPMFIQTSISFSYDVFILGLSFLVFAYFTRWYFIDEKISVKEYITVFLICFFLAPAKVVYGLTAFLFWFVPCDRYKNKKYKILLTILLCLPTIYQLFDIMISPLLTIFKYAFTEKYELENIKSVSLPSFYKDNIYSITRNTNYDFGILKVGKGYSFKYMARHPLEILGIMIRTVRYRIKFWFYGSLGRELSGGTLILPLTLVHILVGIALSSAFVKEDYTFNIPMKVINIVMCIGVGAMVLVGFLATWTDSTQLIEDAYGGILIEGIQGRYFDPILAYFFTVLTNKKIYIPKKFSKYILLVYIPVFFEVVVYVLSYTFVN